MKHKIHSAIFVRQCFGIAFFVVSVCALTSCGGGGGGGATYGGTGVVQVGASGNGPANGAGGAGGAGGASASPGGTLVLKLDGANPGIDQDVLEVAGQATLGGTLVLEFGADFMPVAGQRFTVIKAAGGLSGGFVSVTNNKDLSLTTSQDATNFFVTVGG